MHGCSFPPCCCPVCLIRGLQGKLDPAARRKTLVSSTHFNESEVEQLQQAYNRLKYRSTLSSGVVDFACLESVMGPYLPPKLLHRLFAAWDSKGNGVADVGDLATVRCPVVPLSCVTTPWT